MSLLPISSFSFIVDIAPSALAWFNRCKALLRAIAEKLIPGIPEGTRIALLQQSKLVDENDNATSVGKSDLEQSVLQEVVDRATALDSVEQEIKCKLIQSLPSDRVVGDAELG